MNSSNCVYVISKYAFYDGGYILMVSKSLIKAQEYYNQCANQLERGYGLILRKYVYDKKYDVLNEGETIDRIEKDYLEYDCDMCKYYVSSTIAGKYFEECKKGHIIDKDKDCKDFKMDNGDDLD